MIPLQQHVILAFEDFHQQLQVMYAGVVKAVFVDICEQQLAASGSTSRWHYEMQRKLLDPAYDHNSECVAQSACC